MSDLKALSDSEMKVMELIWREEGPVTTLQIIDFMTETDNSAPNKSTINTFLSRMLGKGVLKVMKKRNTNYYEAALSKSEYLSFESKKFLGKYFNNSIRSFISAFTESADITKEELEDLRKWFSEETKSSEETKGENC